MRIWLIELDLAGKHPPEASPRYPQSRAIAPQALHL
jgi:hypothetical protein